MRYHVEHDGTELATATTMHEKNFIIRGYAQKLNQCGFRVIDY